MTATQAQDLVLIVADLVRLQSKMYTARMLCGQAMLRFERGTEDHFKLTRIFGALGDHASDMDLMLRELQAKETK